MNEREWVKSLIPILQTELQSSPQLRIEESFKLPYANEILSYRGSQVDRRNTLSYETDLLISETLTNDEWQPRLIIEAKLGRITTHDAITYSQKAATHKSVHPYLRYGILIGNREHHPLPGRLFRHGSQFDFMLSWQGHDPINEELDHLLYFINEEIAASRSLEEIIFNSRSPKRERYTFLHRPLVLK